MGASYPLYVLVCFTEESGSPFSAYETKFVELHEGVQYDNFDYSQKYRSVWPMNKKSKTSVRYPCKVLRFSDSLLALNTLCKNLVDGSMTLKELEEERLVLGEQAKDNGVMKKLTQTKEDIADEVSDGDDKDMLRGKRKRTPSTKLKDSKLPLEKKKAVSTKFVKKTATQKRKHSKEVGKKIIKELNRLEDDEEDKAVSSNSDANESNSSVEEDEIDDQDLLEQEMGIVPQSVTRKQKNKQSSTKKNMVSTQSFELAGLKSFTRLSRAGLSDSSHFSSTSAFGQLNVDENQDVDENQEKDCSKCSNFESRIMKLQSDLSISYAKNGTLRDQLTSSDAKLKELQALICYYEVSRPTTKLGWDIQKLIEAHVSGPVMMGNFKSSTDEYPDEPFGQQFSAWKSQKAVHVPEVDLRHNSPPLPALKKTIPPTAGLNVESIFNVKTAPLIVHASENGSSDDNKELTEEIRFPIPDSVLDLFSTKTLSNFVGKTMEYLHPDDDYLATRNLSDRNMSAQKIQAGNASDKIPMTEEEIQQVVGSSLIIKTMFTFKI
ncbi:hypothetical protein OUZ56_007922 [Daphnia magna]|uniref:Uncharacterized protein n=1 Tax=Daphnia magna TaxID=35525 RepID=A0ABR0ABG5_9CRUS|nr:hypothetical protein OUZ56_007922 [Daphnia magna]